MHPRNPYHLAPPDFRQLAVAQPSLAPLYVVVVVAYWLLPGGSRGRVELCADDEADRTERSVFENHEGRPTIDFKRADAVRSVLGVPSAEWSELTCFVPVSLLLAPPAVS
jgi:hypothetical protein